MTGRDLLLSTFRHERHEGVPWVPFAGVHAGKLVGADAKELYTDEDKLVEALIEVNRIYRPDGQPVMFDLQLEAEALGCGLLWSNDSPPTVTGHPLESTDEIPTELPSLHSARLPMYFSAIRRLREAVGQTTAIFGLFCGPFTLASHLRGTNIFMDMFDEPDYVKALIDYATRVGSMMATEALKAGADVVAAVDPLVSQISPDHFRDFLTEPFRRLFGEIRAGGGYSSFFVCGDATRNIEPMCETGPDGIAVDENINMVKAKEITDRFNVSLAGNIPLASVMLFGNQKDNMKSVVDLLDSVDHHNLIISPGCDMPFDTPIENTVACEQAVHQTEQTRTLIASYTRELPDIPVELPNYDALPRPLVEVFTIDSDTCAACTYMFQSAMDAKRKFGDGLDVVEYKATSMENIVRAAKMEVKQLPAIYINGKLAFSSIIPSREALNQAIEASRA